jgi:hypothetical protein
MPQTPNNVMTPQTRFRAHPRPPFCIFAGAGAKGVPMINLIISLDPTSAAWLASIVAVRMVPALRH